MKRPYFFITDKQNKKKKEIATYIAYIVVILIPVMLLFVSVWFSDQ